MTEPYKVSRATAVVEVAAVSPGDNPTISVVYHAANSRGIERQFVRQVPVPNAALFGRIQASVKAGDQIEATTVNEWYDTGYMCYLADFNRVPDAAQESVVKNGAHNAVPNDLTEIFPSPTRGTKAKIRH